jgi:hypothetical protein
MPNLHVSAYVCVRRTTARCDPATHDLLDTLPVCPIDTATGIHGFVFRPWVIIPILSNLS